MKTKSVSDTIRAMKTTAKLKGIVPTINSSETEYLCSMYFYYNPSKKKQQYAIAIETTRQFSVLSYNLTINSRKIKNVIDVKLLGLTATNNYINEPGPASSILFFDDLYGEHTINIIKQDESINTAVLNFNVFKKKIELIKEIYTVGKDNSRFCIFKIAEEKFTFA